jgi:CRP-like cAMP-binding protein
MARPEEMFGIRYEGGDVIFREGDAGDTMYVILSGEVEITQTREGKVVELARLKRGDFFGELALLDDMPRSANATALHSTRVLPMNRRTLLVRAEDDPQVLVQVLGALSLRIEKADALIPLIVKDDKDLSAVWEASRAGANLDADAAVAEGQATGCLPSERRVRSLHRSPEELLFGDAPNNCDHYDAGSAIFKQGDPGEAMYFIVDGAVDIVHDRDGNVRRLARLGPHEFFGEMALITGRPRTASAVAKTAVRLVSVDKNAFISKIKSKPDLGFFIVQVLASRLRALVGK